MQRSRSTEPLSVHAGADYSRESLLEGNSNRTDEENQDIEEGTRDSDPRFSSSQEDSTSIGGSVGNYNDNSPSHIPFRNTGSSGEYRVGSASERKISFVTRAKERRGVATTGGTNPGQESRKAKKVDRAAKSSPGRIATYCVAEQFEMQKLIGNYLLSMKTELFRDAFHVRYAVKDVDIFFFTYGVVVTWGLEERQEQKLIEEIKPFMVNPVNEVETDDFEYFIVSEEYQKTPVRIVDDAICMRSDAAIKHRLAVSHGLSQCSKLSYFESQVDAIIQLNEYLIEDWARLGKISLTRKDLAKKMGMLFKQKSSINLQSDLLDTPEYFYEHSKYEPFYERVVKYLDKEQRQEALNKRLDIIQELFEMLNNELHGRHELAVEYIIILLIVIEVVAELIQLGASYVLHKFYNTD